jgi:sialate O-acetylesterase
MKRKASRWVGLVLGVFGLLGPVGGTLIAAITVPSIFGDHMVLQANQPIPVWGWAAPGEKIAVRLGNTELLTTADPQGNWQVRLPARPAAVDQVLTLQGVNTLQFTDVLVGEVWLGSGQSNMQWPVSQTRFSSQDVSQAANSRIRLFTVERAISILPETNCKGTWQVCNPRTVAGFSAVAYFFGRKLERELKTPVGLINSSWGGTRIEPWTPFAALGKIPGFEGQITSVEALRAGMDKLMRDYELQIKEAHSKRAAALALEADETQGSEYRRADYNDRDWPVIAVQGVNWEKTVLTNFDGVVWYRHSVEIPADWAGQDLEMRLGPVDEMDVTWFNETRVGGMGLMRKEEIQYWDVPRVYKVPGSAVKAGRNTITVRVIDTGYAGGIWGAAPGDMKLVLASGKTDLSVALAGNWKYKVALKFIPVPKSPTSTATPTTLYNAMINPVVPYGIRGALWYQGEANVSEGVLYTHKMRALIEGWRTAWGQGDFPFYYVQLAPYVYGTNTLVLPQLWDAQRQALAIKNTGMAVTTDLGNMRDIHPRRKVEVGERLALWALAQTYGQTNVVCSGPLVKAAVREEGNLRLTFEGWGGGLVGREGDSLSWFDIAGADGQFVHAMATIEGSTVRVWSDQVAVPTRVRYGFATEAEPELFNAEGLPASPFEVGVSL